LIAGAMLPASIYNQAQRFRRQFRQDVLASFEKVDVILAPATPCVAPKIGQQTLQLDEVEIPLRPNIGLYTQPISFIGLPVVAVPIPGKELPIGVQIIAAPWREDIAMRVAAHLEMSGVASAPDPLQ
jgi:aspartyl-tRNA(Asn)/glutamyl-tRNA(Gln) amidotransferase subunit A